MLQTSSRVPKTVISLLLKKGTRVHTDFFQCMTNHNGKEQSRCAVVVGGRIVKRAVERNRIKRMVKAAFQSLHTTLHPSADLVILVKQQCATRPYRIIREQLQEIISKINALT